MFVCAYKDDTDSSEKTAQIIDKKQIKEAYTVKYKYWCYHSYTKTLSSIKMK